MDGSWNQGVTGTATGAFVGSSPRLVGEPPLSPPSSGSPGTGPLPALRVSTPPAPPAPTAPAPAAAPPPREESPSVESLLVRFRLVTPAQLEEALAHQRASGRDVAEIVLERGWVNHDQMARVLAYVPTRATPPPLAPTLSAVPAPVPEPEPEPAAVPAAEPAPTPAAEAGLVARVFVRFTDGDRVEVAAYADLASAKARGAEVVEQILGTEGWPFVGGRFVRPEAVVSVDVEATPA